jgi:hypothetical protein
MASVNLNAAMWKKVSLLGFEPRPRCHSDRSLVTIRTKLPRLQYYDSFKIQIRIKLTLYKNTIHNFYFPILERKKA